MNPNEKRIWFPAKKYGWGWGAPCSWQGWTVFSIWLALLCVGGIFLAPHSVGLYVLYAIVLGIALFIVALIKGERPRWRWGKE